MAQKNIFNGNGAERFQKQLLDFLKSEPDNVLRFDRPFVFHSSRYDHDLYANNVHYDRDRGEVVLVGVSNWNSGRSLGKPLDTDNADELTIRSNIRSTSVRTTVSLPFMEVFNDLSATRISNVAFSGNYLISKTRKAVLDKYVIKPLRRMEGLSRSGVVNLDDLLPDRSAFSALIREPSLLSVSSDGKVSIVASDGIAINVSALDIEEVRRIGERLLYGVNLAADAAALFAKVKSSVVSPDGLSHSYSEYEEKIGEMKGLNAIYGRFPLRVCHTVARSMSQHFRDVFNDERHSPASIQAMIRTYRSSGRGFGSFGITNSPD